MAACGHGFLAAIGGLCCCLLLRHLVAVQVCCCRPGWSGGFHDMSTVLTVDAGSVRLFKSGNYTACDILVAPHSTVQHRPHIIITQNTLAQWHQECQVHAAGDPIFLSTIVLLLAPPKGPPHRVAQIWNASHSHSSADQQLPFKAACTNTRLHAQWRLILCNDSCNLLQRHTGNPFS